MCKFGSKTPIYWNAMVTRMRENQDIGAVG